jgi:hypothetical protein
VCASAFRPILPDLGACLDRWRVLPRAVTVPVISDLVHLFDATLLFNESVVRVYIWHASDGEQRSSNYARRSGKQGDLCTVMLSMLPLLLFLPSDDNARPDSNDDADVAS